MPGPSTPGGAANIATARWYCRRAWRWRIRPSATNQAAAALNALDNQGYENEKALIRVRVNRLRLALTAV
jgi:hypothetical protein